MLMANDRLVRANAGAILEREMEELIGRELPNSNPKAAKYLAHLFATAPLANLQTMKLNWAGLRIEGAEDDDRERVLGSKLRHSRALGDSCLVYCTFYKEETDGRSGRPGLELAGLGKAGYNAAGFYATMLGKEESAVYPQLSNGFPMVIVRVGPAIFRKYLGDLNPPQRVIFYTPHGEIILRFRPSLS